MVARIVTFNILIDRYTGSPTNNAVINGVSHQRDTGKKQ